LLKISSCIGNRYYYWLWYFEGLFTNFEYIPFFSCLNKRNIFCKRSISILDKTTLTRNNWEKWCSKSVRGIYVIYRYNSTGSDWLWAPYFLNYFESELFYRDGPFTKNVSFVGARKKVIYSKLVNIPFNEVRHLYWIRYAWVEARV